MNFAKTIKKELLEKPIKDKCCKKAFLTGLIRGVGNIYEVDDSLGFDFFVSDEETAMLVANYFKRLFDYDVREVSVSEDRLNKKDKFTFSIVGEKATDILKELGILIETENELALNLKIFSKGLEKDCCVKSLLKGLFISVGSCTVPSSDSAKNTGYHLELIFSHYVPALSLNEKLSDFGVETKIMRRKDSFIVYIKSAESITDFVALLGASRSVLELTDRVIERQLTNKSNRQKNCDVGNISRQIDASTKQTEAIEIIKNTVGLESLKPDLKLVASARLNYPEDTISELANKLNITKSCLNHRLRKLIQIAYEGDK